MNDHKAAEVLKDYRRDVSIALPVEKMIISSASGIPILAPEIVLLYKSRKPEADAAALSDFNKVLPQLSSDRREWLAHALKMLYQDHMWLKELS